MRKIPSPKYVTRSIVGKRIFEYIYENTHTFKYEVKVDFEHETYVLNASGAYTDSLTFSKNIFERKENIF